MKSNIYIILAMQILISCSSNKTEEKATTLNSSALITLNDAQAKNANLSIGNLEKKKYYIFVESNG